MGALLDKLENKEDFTSAEAELADYVLAQIRDVSALTTGELAARSYTSKATITRFVHKLGMQNYTEFRLQIEREAMQIQRAQTLLGSNVIRSDFHYSDITSGISNIYNSVIQEVDDNLDSNAVRRIASRIMHAEIVDIYGAGIAYSLADAASFKFRTLGIPCNSYSGLNEHYIQMSGRKENRISILLSFTGRNPEMLHIAKYLKKNSEWMAVIGSPHGDALRGLSNEYLTTFNNRFAIGTDIISNSIALNYILDLLFLMVVARDYQKYEKNYREIRGLHAE